MFISTRGSRAAVIVLSLLGAGVSSAQTLRGAAADNGEWPHCGGDLGHTRYAPLDVIDASNFSSLQVAWRFSVANLGPTPEAHFQSTPLVGASKADWRPEGQSSNSLLDTLADWGAYLEQNARTSAYRCRAARSSALRR